MEQPDSSHTSVLQTWTHARTLMHAVLNAATQACETNKDAVLAAKEGPDARDALVRTLADATRESASASRALHELASGATLLRVYAWLHLCKQWGDDVAAASASAWSAARTAPPSSGPPSVTHGLALPLPACICATACAAAGAGWPAAAMHGLPRTVLYLLRWRAWRLLAGVIASTTKPHNAPPAAVDVWMHIWNARVPAWWFHDASVVWLPGTEVRLAWLGAAMVSDAAAAQEVKEAADAVRRGDDSLPQALLVPSLPWTLGGALLHAACVDDTEPPVVPSAHAAAVIATSAPLSAAASDKWFAAWWVAWLAARPFVYSVMADSDAPTPLTLFARWVATTTFLPSRHDIVRWQVHPRSASRVIAVTRSLAPLEASMSGGRVAAAADATHTPRPPPAWMSALQCHSVAWMRVCAAVQPHATCGAADVRRLLTPETYNGVTDGEWAAVWTTYTHGGTLPCVPLEAAAAGWPTATSPTSMLQALLAGGCPRAVSAVLARIDAAEPDVARDVVQAILGMRPAGSSEQGRLPRGWPAAAAALSPLATVLAALANWLGRYVGELFASRYAAIAAYAADAPLPEDTDTTSAVATSRLDVYGRRAALRDAWDECGIALARGDTALAHWKDTDTDALVACAISCGSYTGKPATDAHAVVSSLQTQVLTSWKAGQQVACRLTHMNAGATGAMASASGGYCTPPRATAAQAASSYRTPPRPLRSRGARLPDGGTPSSSDSTEWRAVSGGGADAYVRGTPASAITPERPLARPLPSTLPRWPWTPSSCAVEGGL